MFKVKRNPKKFETFDLFSTLVEELGYNINDENVVETISDIFSKSVEDGKKSDIMLHGARNEGLFSYIVRGMDSVKFIKKEDAGDAYTFMSEKIQIPDFRIILDDNSLIFVEVKNFNKEYNLNFSLNISYVESLERYCSLNGGTLLIAVYYRSINRWVLLPINKFTKNGMKYEISLEDSLKFSELSRLGDIAFALYDPLEIYFEFEKNTSINKFDGESYNYEGKINNIILKCGDKEINDEVGRRIIYTLANYGEWSEKSNYIFEADELIGLKLTYQPEEGFDIDSEIEVRFKLIAQYSVMLTNFFAQKTIKENKITKLIYSGKPTDVSSLIPIDYKNPDLSIVRMKFVSQSYLDT